MAVIIFIVGIVIGSFLNVCIYRIPKEESITYPPSHCMKCNHKIKAYDLIPIVSYIILKGKCRYCSEEISIRYPIIEFICGILFLVTYFIYGYSFEFIKYATLICFLMVIALIDMDTTDVYFNVTLTGMVVGIIFILIGKFVYGYSVLNYLEASLLAGGVIELIAILTRGMGFGDVEICALIGLFLGVKPTVVMLFLSFIIGAIMGIILIALKIKTRKDYIPFGPAIAIAAIFAMLYGEKIFNWYLHTNF